MKKFLVCLLAIVMICAFSFAVFAEEPVEVEMTIADDTLDVTDNPTNGTETTDSVGETTETPTETTDSAIVPPEEVPEEVPEEKEEDLTVLISKKFEEWVIPHLEEISVIVTLIGTLFYQIRKNKSLGKVIGTMNNNTITIAEQSSAVMNQALSGMMDVSTIVTQYDARIKALLAAHDETAKDKEKLEKELAEIRTYLKTAAESNIEFANELAELLGLANIPNYKKEEIGARHLAAVNSIKAAETEALSAVQEVKDVGEEA
jgi:hypothetical protein